MKRSICCMVALMFVLPVLSLTVAAQTQQGDILGTVRDEQGSVMVGVQITIANETTGAVRNVSTDERGEYLALGFFSGFYRVEAALQGFQKAVVNGVKIEDQSRKRVDLVLKIGEITTEITVTDKASAIKTEGATVTTTMPRIFFEKNLTVDDAAGPGLQQAMWFPGSSAT
ncbi:MAG: carboxypeptidase regulatory-like domain-containing protein, partial [Acidimicrobiia bacterium]|nr:carboxypeptidase regulatory-like domain-containing protein [Acidimicrobiia bacterium]